LSHKVAETTLWRQARRHSANDGTLLSVAGLRPSLVLTMGGGGRDRGSIAARLGIRMLDLPYPQSLADMARSVVEVSRALGRPAAGAAELRRLAALHRTFPPLLSTQSGWAAAGAACRRWDCPPSGWPWLDTVSDRSQAIG
jgi:iron complex transport system substrate-binding protein